MEKKKLWMAIGLAAVLLLAVLLLVLPPVVLSSNWAQKLIFSRVNKSIPGKLSAGSCTVGWHQGPKCRNVVYIDRNMRLDIAELRISKGLWPLLTKAEELGTIAVDDPVLLLEQPPAPQQGQTGKADKPVAPAGPQEVAKEQAAAKQEPPGFLEKMTANLTISRAVVKLAGAGQEPLVRSGNLKADIAAGELKFDLAIDAGADGKGTAVGAISLPAAIKGDLAAALSKEMQIKLASVQAKPFLALAKDLPQGQASLSANLALKKEAGGNLAVRGPISLNDVDLSGGMLAQDHPRFGQLDLDLDVQRKAGNAWQLPGLRLFSDFGSLELHSTSSGTGFKSSGQGKIDLSILLTQLPHLFKIRDDLRLDRGELNLTFSAEKNGEQLQLTADATVDSLAGRRNAESFSWNSPLHLNVDGSLANKEPELKKLTLSAPFLNLEAQGNLNRFSLTGSADLTQAMQEISRIVRLDWNAGGKAQLDFQMEKKDNARYAIQTKVDIADCQLGRKGREVLPPNKLNFSGRLDTPGKVPENSAEAAELSFSIDSWAGSCSGSLDGLYRKPGQPYANASYQLETNLVLARITELLHKLSLIDAETTLAGNLELRASGYAEESRLVLRDFSSRLSEFIFYRQGKFFRDPDLRLATVKPEAGAAAQAEDAVRPLVEADNPADFFARGGGYNLIDTARRRLVLRDFQLSSRIAEINAKMLALDDWQQKPLPAIKNLQISGTSDLSKLSALLRQLELTGPEQNLAGTAAFRAELTEQTGLTDGRTAAAGNTGAVEIDLDHFVFGTGNSALPAEQKIGFRSKLHGNLAAGDLYFTTFDLQAAPLNVQSSGRMELAGKEPHFSLEGTAAPDFAALAALLNGIHPLDISMSGKKKEQFSLHYSLGKQKDAGLQFANRLYADSFVKAGMKMTNLSLASDMKNGILSTALQGAMYGGDVRLSPRFDFTRKPAVAALAQPEQVLNNVGLEQPLADGLLKSIHPLLGALASPSGTISLRADRLSLPLGEKGAEQAEFKIVFDLNKVMLEPVSVLGSILDLAGIAKHSLNLKEKSLVCEGKKGRITCSPIKITAADSEMVMSGSAGFDGSLDYALEVPVTKNLVGRRGYELLKGATLKVPITGTKDRPFYNPESLMQAAAKLVRQAGEHAARQTIQNQVKKALPDLPGLFDSLLGH